MVPKFDVSRRLVTLDLYGNWHRAYISTGSEGFEMHKLSIPTVRKTGFGRQWTPFLILKRISRVWEVWIEFSLWRNAYFCDVHRTRANQRQLHRTKDYVYTDPRIHWNLYSMGVDVEHSKLTILFTHKDIPFLRTPGTEPYIIENLWMSTIQMLCFSVRNQREGKLNQLYLIHWCAWFKRFFVCAANMFSTGVSTIQKWIIVFHNVSHRRRRIRIVRQRWNNWRSKH